MYWRGEEKRIRECWIGKSKKEYVCIGEGGERKNKRVLEREGKVRWIRDYWRREEKE